MNFANGVKKKSPFQLLFKPFSASEEYVSSLLQQPLDYLNERGVRYPTRRPALKKTLFYYIRLNSKRFSQLFCGLNAMNGNAGVNSSKQW